MYVNPVLCEIEMQWGAFLWNIYKHWGEIVALGVNTNRLSPLCYYFCLFQWCTSLSSSDCIHMFFHLSSPRSILVSEGMKSKTSKSNQYCPPQKKSVIMKSIDWDKVWPEQFLGIVCHHFFLLSLILSEPPCLAELERIQVQEAAKKKPGKCIYQTSAVKLRMCLIEGFCTRRLFFNTRSPV